MLSGSSVTIDNVLHASHAALLESVVSRPAEAHLIAGPFGIGKTGLLNELGDRLSASRCIVLRIAVPDNPESAASATRSLHGFRQCLDIATQIGDQFKTIGEQRLSRNLTVLTRRAQFNPITVNQSISATDQASVNAGGAQSVQLNWGEHLTILDGLLGDEVVTAINHRMKKSAIAILIDDIHHLEGFRGEAWLVDIVRRTPGARVIATRRLSRATPMLARAFSRHALGPLPRQDVAVYLGRRLGATASVALVDLVCATTGRLPWGVAFVAERLIRSPDMTQRELEELLDTTNVSSDLADLVDVCLVRLPPELRQAIDQLSVLRDFDRRAAEYMLAADQPSAEHADTLLADLHQELLLEAAASDERGLTRSSDPASSQGCIRMPDIIRTAVMKRNSRRDPFRFVALHRRASGFYSSAVERVSADLDDPFLHWSAIEGGVSQRYLSEWIYHVANTTETIPSDERSKIVRWYLEGFFWYEWKVPHWFCQRLLGYCEVVRRGSSSVEWLDCMHTLHQHYPRGWRKEADPATWHRVIDALIQLRGYVRKPGAPPTEATDSSQAYALATHLLAEALHFSRADLDVAAERYQEAARWYVGDSNAWCRSYALLHQADLATQQGNPTLARAELSSLLASAKHYEDIEMFCHALRLQGDERWLSGRLEEAMMASLLAVLHAIAYQTRQIFLPEMVHFPDAYTREVYKETVSRASARVGELEQVDSALATTARRAAKRLFASFWEYDNTISADSFPPPPADVDLGRTESDYVSRVRWLVEKQSALLWNVDVSPSALGMEQ
jgi:hypothetical protein